MSKTSYRAATAGALALGATLVLTSTFAMGAPGGQRGFDFSQFDADGNGEITQAEVTAFETARFNEADANNDGLLSEDELVAMIQTRMGSDIGDRAQRMITRQLARLDTDKDGAVSLEEQQASERSARIFERLDANDDGAISAEEAQAMADKRAGGKRGGKHGGKHGDKGGRGDRGDRGHGNDRS